MIDIRLVRTELDAVKASLARKGVAASEVERLAQLDARVRETAGRRDDVRARIKTVSQEVAAARRAGDAEKAEALAAESRALGEEEHALSAESTEAEAQLRELLLRVPNLPAEEAPEGASDADNPVVRTVGFDPDVYAAHQRVPHWDIGAELGIIDLERAVKVAGSMFVMYRGLGATLVRALCQLFLDRGADAYEEIRPPTLVTTETLTATGQLPKFADDAYHVERDDLWAIPTAEVPLTSLAADEILAEAELPMRLMAYTPCFRREAGSAGRDTRGLLRSHEFDKVELLAYTTPAQAPAVLDEILGRAEALVEELELPHRVVEICVGDLGQSHHRSFDVEVYSPGVDAWLEVSSISWFTDYQARRANVRYRPTGQKGTAFVHTLNGSALAVPRVFAALLETHRQPDGTVRLPAALHPYMRGRTVIGRR